ncbi:hypothetical protein ACDQ55_14180 [Chitinophaga sp. 30R24]|uniref:hypothetical protein n=1 Tax=Chitinophaga sp. 30R24 TaxID=3248838 RepID=UPI003B8F3D69
MQTSHRDYSTISPSAKSLLMLKGTTRIPFAKEAAQLLVFPKTYEITPTGTDWMFWVRVLHFEERYWSIDQLLSALPIKNVLELSSGFSFRGLAAAKDHDDYYIDTDLPEVVAIKQSFVAGLYKGPLKGHLELLPLNALDEEQFQERVSRFPAGPLAIVNEGLLMYLDQQEKEKLCGIVRRVLQQRGGYWITADIYIKKEEARAGIIQDQEWKAFYAQHHIHENMFDSFEAAEIFFKEMGFVVDKVAVKDYSRLTALPRLLSLSTNEQQQKMRGAGQIRTTWQLKLPNE